MSYFDAGCDAELRSEGDSPGSEVSRHFHLHADAVIRRRPSFDQEEYERQKWCTTPTYVWICDMLAD
jgi:hypothetical protein